MVLFVDANAMYNPFDFQQQSFRSDGGPKRPTRTSSGSACPGRKNRVSSARSRDSPVKDNKVSGDIGEGLVVCSEQWKVSKGVASTCNSDVPRGFARTDDGCVPGAPPGLQAAGVGLGIAGRTPPRAPLSRSAQGPPREKPPFVSTVRAVRGAAQRGSGSAPPPARPAQSSPSPSRFDPPARRSSTCCADAAPAPAVLSGKFGRAPSEGSEIPVRTQVSSQLFEPTNQAERQRQAGLEPCLDAAPKVAQMFDGPRTNIDTPPASSSMASAAAAADAPSVACALTLTAATPELGDLLGNLRGLRAAARRGPEPTSKLTFEEESNLGACDCVDLVHIESQEVMPRSASPDDDPSAERSRSESGLLAKAADAPDPHAHNQQGAASIERDVMWQQAELRVFLRRAGLEDLFLPITAQLAPNLEELLAVPEVDIRRLPWRGKGGQRLLLALKTERGRRTISLDIESQEITRGREFIRRSQSAGRGRQPNLACNQRSRSCVAVEVGPSASEKGSSTECTLHELVGDSCEHVAQHALAASPHPAWIGPTDESTQGCISDAFFLAAAKAPPSADPPALQPSGTTDSARHGGRHEESAIVKGKRPPPSAPPARFRPPSRGAARVPKKSAQSLVPRCAPGSTVSKAEVVSHLQDADGGYTSRSCAGPTEIVPQPVSRSACPLQDSCGSSSDAICEASCGASRGASREASRKAPGGGRPSARSKTRKARIHELLRALAPCPFEVARISDRQFQAQDRHVQRRSPSPGVGRDASSSERRPGRSLMELVAASAKEDPAAASPLGDLVASLPTALATEGCTEICAICLEVPTCGEEVTSLPCFHAYHKECIHEWLVHSRLCPLCKGPADVCIHEF